MCIGIDSDIFVNKMLKIHKNRGYMAKKVFKKSADCFNLFHNFILIFCVENHVRFFG